MHVRSMQKEWSALHLACRAGDLEIVQRIVALGAEIDMPTNVRWMLVYTTIINDSKVVSLFFRKSGHL